MIRRFLQDEDGANMVEYALLVALIGVLLVTVIVALRQGISNALQSGVTALGSGS